MTENDGPPRRSRFWAELRRPATAIPTAIAIVLFVAGVLVSFYFYQKAEKHGEVIFKVEQVQIFEKQRAGVVPLTVYDDAGRIIDNNIYAASVTIWNAGNTDIKKDDVREPFILRPAGDATRVIDILPAFFSRNNADHFTINQSTGEISWQHIDESEGIKIRIIYVAASMESILLKGYAVGTTITDVQEMESRQAFYKKWKELLRLWFPIIVSVLVVFLIGLMERQLARQQRLGRKLTIVISAFAFGLGLVSGILTRGPTLPTPPF